jgi:hypothetical protein
LSPDQMLAQQLKLLAEQNSLLAWYVGATFVIAVATALNLFQDWFRGLLTRVTLEVEPGEMVSTPMGSPPIAMAHYVRLRVANRSKWKAARNVEVILERVSKKGAASGQYVQGGGVFGINLEWSNFPGMPLMPQIGPDTSRTVDLGHVVRPSDRPALAANADPGVEDKPRADPQKTILKLGTVVSPYTRNHLLEPGEWEIQLRLSGTNVKSRRIAVRARLEGSWSNDPATFAQDCLAFDVE